MSDRVPSPKDTIKIRRLPKARDELSIKVRVTRVDEPEGSHQGRVTYVVPGAPTPITVPAGYVTEVDD